MSGVRKSDRKRKEPERLVYETKPITKTKKNTRKVSKPVKVLKRSGVKVAAPIKKTKKIAIKKATSSSVVTIKGRSTRGPPAKKLKTTTTTATRKAPKKTVSDEEMKETELETKSKKRKRASSSTPKPIALLSEIQRNELEALSVPDLKERLKLNEQILSGNKKELIDRIAECAVNGGLPKCPKCGGGRLKTNKSGYTCPGYYDDDEFKTCDYTAKSVTRTPWKMATGNTI